MKSFRDEWLVAILLFLSRLPRHSFTHTSYSQLFGQDPGDPVFVHSFPIFLLPGKLILSPRSS